MRGPMGGTVRLSSGVDTKPDLKEEGGEYRAGGTLLPAHCTWGAGRCTPGGAIRKSFHRSYALITNDVSFAWSTLDMGSFTFESSRVERSTGLISEHFEPDEFVRAAVGWNRLRLESEIEREVRAVELLGDRAWAAREPPPRACRAYVTFLKRLSDWLRTGVAPRHTRRETRALMLALGEALLARGQVEPSSLQNLQPRRSRNRPA